MILPIPGGVKSNVNVSVLALNSDVQPDGYHGNRSSISPGACVTSQIECNVRDSLLETEIVCIRFCCQDSFSGGYCCPGGKTKCGVQCLPREQRLAWKKRALLVSVSYSSLEAEVVCTAPLMNTMP